MSATVSATHAQIASAPPRLSIQLAANRSIVVSWTNDGPGLVLEQTRFLSISALWQPIQQIPLEQNKQFSVTVDASIGSTFFRLHTPPLTSIRESSPANGETGVAVIRETIVHFTSPLSANAVLTTNNFYAGFGGRRLLSRVELSSDRTKATLFYLEPMPGSTRVVAVFDGTALTDFLGRPLDADGDGQAGGAQLIAFDTLNLTALAGTAVIGTVYASELAPGSDTGTNAVNKPLAGVTITVDGMEQTLRAETDATGNFKLEPAPPGRFFVHIDGRTVTNLAAGIHYPDLAYYPFVGKAWEAVAGRTDNLAGGTGKIYLPLITLGTLQPVSMTVDTTVSFPPSVVSSNPALAGVSIIVPANSLFSDDGTRGGKVGIAPVPPDRLPGPLPPGLEPPIVITVQTDGPLNFDKPAPVCFPNLPDPVLGTPLPAGSKQTLISFNHKKGIWEAVGNMTVSADGKVICTDPGSGILQPGWHGVGPQPDKPKPCSNCCPIGGGGGPQSFSLQSATVRGQGIRPGSVSLQDFTLQCKPCTRDPTLLSACLKDTAKRFRKCFDDGYKEYLRCRKRCKQLYKKGSEYNACIGDSGCTGRGYRDRFNCDDEGTDGTNKCNTCYSPPLFPANGNNSSPLLPSRRLGLANPPSVRDQILDLVDQALNLESALYAPDAPPVTSAMDAQVQALLDQADRLAGGDAEQFLSDDSKGIDGTFDGAAARIDSTPDEVPPYPVLFAAEIQRLDGIFVIRGETGPFGDYALFVPRDGELLSVSFYDPHTKRYDVVHPDPDPNAPYRLPQFNLVPMGPSMPDTDQEGLSDIAELVFGTDPAKADTDGDGVPDGAEVEQGTDPLDGRPTQTGIIATAKTPGPALDICAVNNLAILAEGTNGVSVFNVFAGQNPTLMVQIDTPGFAQRVACGGDLVAVADGSAGLAVLDISSPAAARLAWQVSLGANAQSVAVAGNLAYVGLESGYIVTVDMQTGTVLDRVSVGAAVQDLALGGDFLYALTVDRLISLSLLNGLLSVAGSRNSPYLAAPNARLFVGGDIAYSVHNKGYNTLSLTNPAQPALIAAANTTQFGWKQIVPNGSGLGVAAVSPILAFENPATHNVSLYDLKDPTKTDVFLTEFPTPGFARAVSIFNGLAYVADDFAGLQVINYLAYDAKGVPPVITLATSFSTNGVEEGKPARVTANVTDDVQVRNVEFYLDGVKVVTDGNFPFEHRFAAPLLAPGRTSFRVRALATDTGGNSTWSDEMVVPLLPDRTPPTILRLLPGDGAVFLTNTPIHFSARMSEAINAATWNATSVQVFSAGADGLAGTSDDVPVTGAALSYRDDLSTAFLDINLPMPAGLYRVAVRAPLADLAGNTPAAPVVWTFRIVNTFTITYSRAGSPEDTIWLAGADGSFERQVTTGEHPRLSPDGKYLLFLRGGGSGNFAYGGSMFVRDLQTTNETQIFNNSFDYVVYFDWQPDSTRIVFDYSCSIYTMNRDGTPNPASPFIQQPDCYDDAPAINQVDGRVAFHKQQSGLLFVDANGGGQVSIPNTAPGDYWAAWSPDGQWLSFLRSTTTNYFKIRPDGSGLTQLTAFNPSNGDGLSPESPAVWTPDSQAVVAPAKINGVQGIYIFPANGAGSFTRVPTAPGADVLCVGSVSVVAPLAAGP